MPRTDAPFEWGGGHGLHRWWSSAAVCGAGPRRRTGTPPGESAGRRRGRTSISREGKAELREAILELGKALRQGHPDFARYAADLAARGKAPGVVACALGHRANRAAFAMVRDQRAFDPERWG